jgi:hypothetical protein
VFTRKVAQLAYRWCASVRGSYGMSDAVKENSAPHNARSAELDRANEEYRSLLREQVVGNFCVVPVEAAMKEAGFGGTKGAVDAAALRKLVVPGDAADRDAPPEASGDQRHGLRTSVEIRTGRRGETARRATRHRRGTGGASPLGDRDRYRHGCCW